MLALRQLEFAFIEAPKLAADTHNPRHASGIGERGSILASDGTPLALSRNGKRVYPLGETTAHVVGYASVRYGTAGLEDSFDRVLAARVTSSDPFEELKSLLAGGRATPRGADIVTTIDLTVQRALVRQLSSRNRAAGIAIDPRTGAVLALAATPGFDPNSLDARWTTLIRDPASPLLDRSTSGLYPPGSTFKVVTAADALDAGVITPASVFIDNGGLTVGGFTIRNDEGEVTGRQDLAGAFALSSNVDFAQIALTLGVDRWFDYAARWGFGNSLDFDVPTARDIVPKKARCEPLDPRSARLWPSIAPRYAAAHGTRNGDHRRRRPHAASVSRTQYRRHRNAHVDAKRATGRADYGRNGASSPRSHDCHGRAGHGHDRSTSGVVVAGKTGTATNPHGAAHSWFVAFAPAASPRVAVAIVVENAGYGAAIAAPIAREILRVALARTRT